MNWVVFTILAAFFQNLRTSLQKKLNKDLSLVASAYVRFAFALPFAFVLFFIFNLYTWIIYLVLGVINFFIFIFNLFFVIIYFIICVIISFILIFHLLFIIFTYKIQLVNLFILIADM